MKGSFYVSRAGALAWLLAGQLLCPSAGAQSIDMRDGQVVATQGMRRDGATILARVQTKEGTQGEVGYPVDSVARIDFPEPAQLKLARDLLNAGRADEAVRQLTPILAYYTPFHDIPGNWWTPLALAQADAYGQLGREHDQDALLAEISGFDSSDPEVQRDIKIKRAVAAERRGEHQKALDQLEPIVKDATVSPVALAEAWLAVGSARLALRDYKPALLAFLHVPVYTPDRVLLMPAALLGSANAFVGIDDRQRARDALKQVIDSYPRSPEAVQAKERLQHLALPAPKPVTG